MLHSPAFARLRRFRGVASLVVLGFLCRALIPVGFMPAVIGAGGPFALCHGGLAGEFFLRLESQREANATTAAASGHDGHAAHEPALAAGHEAWEHCPFGAAFGAALLAADVAMDLTGLAATLEIVDPSLPVPYRSVSSYRARAPPSSAIYS